MDGPLLLGLKQATGPESSKSSSSLTRTGKTDIEGTSSKVQTSTAKEDSLGCVDVGTPLLHIGQAYLGRHDLDLVEYLATATALESIEWDISRPGRSEVWRYFIRSVCRSHAKCAMCGHVLKTPHAMTTSLKYHLRRTHAVSI